MTDILLPASYRLNCLHIYGIFWSSSFNWTMCINFQIDENRLSNAVVHVSSWFFKLVFFNGVQFTDTMILCQIVWILAKRWITQTYMFWDQNSKVVSVIDIQLMNIERTTPLGWLPTGIGLILGLRQKSKGWLYKYMYKQAAWVRIDRQLGYCPILI